MISERAFINAKSSNRLPSFRLYILLAALRRFFEDLLSQKTGSFSNDEGDGNENVKKSNRLIKQNNKFARASHFSCNISLPSLHDYNEKMHNFTFYGGRKQATTNVSFSF